MPGAKKQSEKKKIRELDVQWGDAGTRKDLKKAVGFFLIIMVPLNNVLNLRTGKM